MTYINKSAPAPRQAVHLFDFVKVPAPCPQCGSTTWIVDSNKSETHHFLTCAGDYCSETLPVPSSMIVQPRYANVNGSRYHKLAEGLRSSLSGARPSPIRIRPWLGMVIGVVSAMFMGALIWYVGVWVQTR
jgi:hypothetical protein